jgi:hypothetical protein
MPWPLMVLDWSRHQLPRHGARCIYASRLAGTGLTSIALSTVQVVGSVATGDGGVLSVKPIRRETSKACTRLT